MVPNLSSRAQASLEYLLTYGWAFILVISIIGVLVFILTPTTTNVSFSVSDRQLLLKGGNVAGAGGADSVSVKLQNATGGSITVEMITLSGFPAAGASATLNGVPFASGSPVSIKIPAGGQMNFENIDAPSGAIGGNITIEFKNAFGYPKSVSVTASSAAGSPPSGPTGTPAYQITGTETCSDQYSATYGCDKSSNGLTTDYWFGLCTGPPKWIYGDLGSKKYISGIRVFIFTGYNPQTMNIDVSDDAATWTNVASGWTVSTGNQWVEKTFTETQGRYVRIYITASAVSCCSMREFEVLTRT